MKNGKQLILSELGKPKGDNFVIGGGFHGKSTVLNALEYGIYNIYLVMGENMFVVLRVQLK